jgi:hypothetical protein
VSIKSCSTPANMTDAMEGLYEKEYGRYSRYGSELVDATLYDCASARVYQKGFEHAPRNPLFSREHALSPTP